MSNHGAEQPEIAGERKIELAGAALSGQLIVPASACGLVIFAHGSGSSRHSPRNQRVARSLREAGLGTLLFDLLTSAEEAGDNLTRELRFNIGFLARRLQAVALWAAGQPQARSLPIGFFGASTGAAAALVAAAQMPARIGAVVSRGGRPDLAGSALAEVLAPTLLIVGGADGQVLALNQDALARLRCRKDLAVIPGAGHLFEEPGALDQAAQLASAWFRRHLGARHSLAAS
jgi:dienelactone hydrolase